MVVHERGLHIAFFKDAAPQVHRVDAEADGADPALPPQFLQSFDPFANGPFHVAAALVLDVVQVNDVEVVDSQTAGALFEGKTHPARDFFANHWVADGDLITGQNQNAGPMVARLMMQRVLAKRAA